MAQVTYQVILSTDGKHTVMATTDDQAMAKEAFGWAKATYDRLVQLYGLKFEQYREAEGNGNGNGQEVPVCAVHAVPMTKQDGKRGPFWSCHQRNPDGTWCSPISPTAANPVRVGRGASQEALRSL